MPASRLAAKKQVPNPAQKKMLSPGKLRAGLLLVLVAGYISYAATPTFEFAYDDFPQIVDNQRIQSAHFLPQYFTHQVWAQLKDQPQNLYRPIYLTWLLLNYSAFGNSAGGWHFVNLLLHLLMTALVYLLGRKVMPEEPLAALIGAAVFALHPIHVEAVAWVSAGTESLMSLLFVGSFLCYVEYRRGNERIGWLAASLLLFVAAILTKETAAVLPGVIACYELFLLRGQGPSDKKFRWTSLVVPFTAYLVVIGAYFVVRTHVLHGMAHRISDVPFSTSLLSWPWAIYFYLSQMIMPLALGPFYDVSYAHGFSLELLLLPLFVLAAVTAALWWWSRKAGTGVPLFLYAWLLLTLLPALAVFTVMSRYENVHDRYLYLPSVGFALLIGYAACVLFRRAQAPDKTVILGTAAAVLLVVLGVATYRQTRYWQDNLTVFTRGVQVAPHNVLAKLNLTSELIRNQMLDGAFQVSRQAVQLDPNSPLALAAAGQAAYLVHQYPLAEEYYSRALTLAPPRVDELYYLGMTRIQTGRFSDALAVLQKGNALWPNSPGYHLAMGKALAGMGQWSAAREEYKLELALNPDSPGAKAGLAEAANK
jgi:tetratricopeptide (TPR) repeat protein